MQVFFCPDRFLHKAKTIRSCTHSIVVEPLTWRDCPAIVVDLEAKKPTLTNLKDDLRLRLGPSYGV